MVLKLLRVFYDRISSLYAKTNGSIFLCLLVYGLNVRYSSCKEFFNTMQYFTKILTTKLRMFILIKNLINIAYEKLEVTHLPLTKTLFYPLLVIKFENASVSPVA